MRMGRIPLPVPLPGRHKLHTDPYGITKLDPLPPLPPQPPPQPVLEPEPDQVPQPGMKEHVAWAIVSPSGKLQMVVYKKPPTNTLPANWRIRPLTWAEDD